MCKNLSPELKVACIIMNMYNKLCIWRHILSTVWGDWKCFQLSHYNFIICEILPRGKILHEIFTLFLFLILFQHFVKIFLDFFFSFSCVESFGPFRRMRSCTSCHESSIHQRTSWPRHSEWSNKCSLTVFLNVSTSFLFLLFLLSQDLSIGDNRKN